MYMAILIGVTIILIAVVKYATMKFDTTAGYIKVGLFKIEHIKNFGDHKMIYLNNRNKIKLDTSHPVLEKLSVDSFIEITKTASNRLVNVKLVESGKDD